MEEDQCICAEWDGKGFSTCGYPCPEHFKGDKEAYLIEHKELLKKLNEAVKVARKTGKPIKIDF